jgi:dUTP pyrophosphatase
VSTSLAVVRLDRDLPMPNRAHDGDAGVDLFSALDVELAPGQRALVPTAGYRGEVKVSLINLDPETPIVVNRGDRIAQLLVQRVELPDLVEVTSFDEAGLADTTRGDGGHGSSGGHASL